MIRKLQLIAVILSAGALLAACSPKDGEDDQSASESMKLDTQTKKVNYAFAVGIAENMKRSGVSIEPEAFAQALKDTRDGKDPQLNQEERQEVMRAFQEEQMAKREEEKEEQAESNRKEAEEFFAKNSEAEGVQETDSGLQYKVLEEGEGATPEADDNVTVHYRGRLLDGTEFDSSYERDQPASFGVSSVIAGWTEALQLMPEGSKYELYIPAELAYGPGGNGPIPPNAALIFEVELLDIESGEQGETTEGETSGESN